MKEINQKGQALIFIALTFVVLGLFVGLAIDGGRAYLLKADLARKIDPAALAAAAKISAGLSAAQAAACNSAKMNGLDCTGLTVTQVTVNTPGGGSTTGIRISATATMSTGFMHLGKLIGCGSVCDSVTVAASAVAAPGGSVDLIMNLDDTASMQSSGWIGPAKNGANALVDAIVPASSSGSSTAKASLVPFRGCYSTSGSSGCENSQEYSAGAIVSLTNSNTTLHSGINALTGNGGSGTNLCEGLSEARVKLFDLNSRTNAQKFVVMLTDAASNRSTSASFSNCNGSSNDQLNLYAYKEAQDLKNGTNVGSTGQQAGQMVTIFVIFYGSSGPSPANCTPPSPSATSWSTTPLNLGRCIASSAAEMYFAPTPSDLQAAFAQIISRLPVRLVM